MLTNTSGPPMADLQAILPTASEARLCQSEQVNASAVEKPPVAILGVPFDHVTMENALERIQGMIQSREPHYVVTANVDFLVQGREDVELRRILCEADLVLCDGTPLLWSAKLLGDPLPERVAGSDMVPLLLRSAEASGLRVFFLGASPESGKAAAERLSRDYPNLKLVGIHSPPYQDLLEMDHDEMAQQIRAAKPDILFVCFGCPKQEKWIAMNYRRLGVPVCIGVGGTLDFLAGRLRRAPLWMRRTGLEWLFRLIQEPRRLFRRYVKDLGVFGVRMLEQCWRMRPHAADSSEYEQVKWNGSGCLLAPATLNRLTAPALHREALARQRSGTPLILDFNNTRSMDSTGVGCVLRLRSRFQRAGVRFLCAGFTGTVRRKLDALGVSVLLEICDNVEEAHDHVARAHTNFLVQADIRPDECRVHWLGEVTAANAQAFWEHSWPHLLSSSGRQCVVDMARVPFIDSSGMSVMIRLRNAASKSEIPLRFTGAEGSVLNAMRVSRMTAFFEEPSEVPLPNTARAVPAQA